MNIKKLSTKELWEFEKKLSDTINFIEAFDLNKEPELKSLRTDVWIELIKRGDTNEKSLSYMQKKDLRKRRGEKKF